MDIIEIGIPKGKIDEFILTKATKYTRKAKGLGDVFLVGNKYQAKIYEINRGELLVKGQLWDTKEEAAKEAIELRYSEEVREAIIKKGIERAKKQIQLKGERIRKQLRGEIPGVRSKAFLEAATQMENNIYGCTHIYKDFFKFDKFKMSIPNNIVASIDNEKGLGFQHLVNIGSAQKHMVSYWHNGVNYSSNILALREAIWAREYIMNYVEGKQKNGDSTERDAVSRLD